MDVFQERGRIYPQASGGGRNGAGLYAANTPLSNLYRGDVRPIGLAVRFYKGEYGAEAGAADVAGVTPDAMRVTPSIGGAFWYDAVVKERHFAVWEGTLDAPADGAYRFGFGHTHGETRVSIDGEILIDSRGDREREIELAAGAHSIRVEYWHGGGGSPFFQVMWTPPGEGGGRLPPERLAPEWEAMFRVVE